MDALSSHYGSSGRLADYRRQFEKTTRSAGDDPSIFAIALETLAVKAFGNMGQMQRLRLIRDHFIAGHSSCELRRYLDSVPPLISGILLTGAESGSVTQTQRYDGSVSLVRNRFIRLMW